MLPLTLFTADVISHEMLTSVWQNLVMQQFILQIRSVLPEADSKGRYKLSHPTNNFGFDYLSLPLIPASGTTLLIWMYHEIGMLNVLSRIWSRGVGYIFPWQQSRQHEVIFFVTLTAAFSAI